MIYVIIAASLALIDLLIKRIIQKKYKNDKTKLILNENVAIKKVRNEGFMTGAFKNKRKLIDFSSVLVLGGLLVLFFESIVEKGKDIRKIGLCIMLAGAISNVYERITKGFVVDYINLRKCKGLKKIVFNLADVFILLGALITLIYEIFSDDN